MASTSRLKSTRRDSPQELTTASAGDTQRFPRPHGQVIAASQLTADGPLAMLSRANDVDLTAGDIDAPIDNTAATISPVSQARYSNLNTAQTTGHAGNLSSYNTNSQANQFFGTGMWISKTIAVLMALTFVSCSLYGGGSTDFIST